MRGREPRRSIRYDRNSVYRACVAFMREICEVDGYALSIVMYAVHMCRRMRHLSMVAELVHPSPDNHHDSVVANRSSARRRLARCDRAAGDDRAALTAVHAFVRPSLISAFAHLFFARLKPLLDSRDVSPNPSISSGKRSSSALSFDESSTLSDDTVKGSDDDDNEEVFTKVSRKLNKHKRKAVRWHSDKLTRQSNTMQMELDTNPADSTTVDESSKPPNTLKTQSNKIAGVFPTAPPRAKPPPPVILRDKSKWNTASNECSRLHINFIKTQNTANERESQGSVTAANYTATRRQIVMRSRVVLNGKSHTGLRSANALKKQAENYPAAIVAKMTRSIMEGVRLLQNLVLYLGKDKKTANAGGDSFRPAPLPSVNPWFKKKKSQQVKETIWESPKPPTPLSHAGSTASALDRNGREMEAFANNLHFNIVTLLTPPYYPNNNNHKPDNQDIALMKGIALKLSYIEPLQCLDSDHRPVLMRLGSLTADCLPSTKTITNWQKMSTVLEEIDTPILNSIPNGIVSTHGIDNAIDALTNHIRTVVENSSRTLPGKSDRKEMPRDVNARMKEVRNENWSALMSEISPNHKAYWGLLKALKTEGAVPTPALKRPYKNPQFAVEHVHRVEEEVRRRVSLPPKDDLDPITHDEVSKDVQGIKIRKAPGRDTISTWKEAVVTSIPKAGKPYDLPAIYRPISLLSVLGVQLALFSDDTAIYLRSNSIGNILPRLQRAIDELTQWLRLWRFDVNPNKSASIKVQFPCRKNFVEEQLTHHGTSKLCALPGLELPPISKFIKDASECFFDVASSHPNPLSVSVVLSPPNHFCRRLWNILIDPPDRPVKVINPVSFPRHPEFSFEVSARAVNFT
ncbi:hypothetical protein EVAR_30933_1 [Eumeta japonica]|uniref:RNA-directed DNA polymerase from mobile element jockey n=1 Tax=Eumeta variegata TaxID=151549 RepID=A0A4C1V3F0_EUMVA|nr:hypothetical protein EVAR_30933_1 [Eumeta japonica]